MIATYIKNRWNHPQGYREVMRISLPLVASLGSITLILFTDRMFLGWYSLDALAAVTPSSITSFTFVALFLGVSQYVNTFVAQYTGAGQPERVGAAIWQGIYFCMVGGAILAALSFIAEPLFALGGHTPDVQKLEVRYFVITFSFMCLIAFVFVVLPGPLVDLFKPIVYTAEEYAAMRGTCINLLRFVAVFTLFDTFCIINTAALKGAGDTRFVGWTVAIMSTCFMVLPVYLVIEVFSLGIYHAWTVVTLYICLLSIVFRWRFKQGKWKTMRVIEQAPPHLPEGLGIPTVDETLG